METETTTAQAPAPTETAPAKPKGKAQKDAIFEFAKEALTSGERQLEAGAPLRPLITKEVRKAIRLRLFEGFKNGSITLSAKAAGSKDDSKLKKYCSSLINNWLKKDPRFN